MWRGSVEQFTGSLEVRRLRRIEDIIEGPVTVHRGATLEVSGLLNGPTVVEPGGTLEVTGVVKGLIVLGAEASCSLFGEISHSLATVGEITGHARTTVGCRLKGVGVVPRPRVVRGLSVLAVAAHDLRELQRAQWNLGRN